MPAGKFGPVETARQRARIEASMKAEQARKVQADKDIVLVRQFLETANNVGLIGGYPALQAFNRLLEMNNGR